MSTDTGRPPRRENGDDARCFGPPRGRGDAVDEDLQRAEHPVVHGPNVRWPSTPRILTQHHRSGRSRTAQHQGTPRGHDGRAGRSLTARGAGNRQAAGLHRSLATGRTVHCADQRTWTVACQPSSQHGCLGGSPRHRISALASATGAAPTVPEAPVRDGTDSVADPASRTCWKATSRTSSSRPWQFLAPAHRSTALGSWSRCPLRSRRCRRCHNGHRGALCRRVRATDDPRDVRHHDPPPEDAAVLVMDRALPGPTATLGDTLQRKATSPLPAFSSSTATER